MSPEGPQITPVILSGGAGTRLWPASRNDKPKQFLPLVDGRTTFSDTLTRISDHDVFLPPIIVTSSAFAFYVADELQRANLSGRIVMEPLRRDSGPAIAVAAALAEQQRPGSILLVLAADHIVKDAEAFVSIVRNGQSAAAAGNIVTFGIKPDKPSPNFGYIEPGENISPHVRRVSRFIEKPKAEKAKQLLEQGCLWNSGNFLFRSDVLLGELASFEPAMLECAKAAAERRKVESAGSFSFETLDEASFSRCPAKSIDFAVMEKTDKAAVIPADYGWSDLGSWEALWEILGKDTEGNVVSGEALLHNTHDSLVYSDGTCAVVVGLEGLAVIATRDAVLVAPRGVSAEVKPVVAKLENSAALRKLTQQHRYRSESWGEDRELYSDPSVSARLVRLKPGAGLDGPPSGAISHYWIMVSGEASATTQDGYSPLPKGKSLHFPQGRQGRLVNTGKDWAEILEVRLTG